jgi:membrane protein implicated in regulation of membrane protease activity
MISPFPLFVASAVAVIAGADSGSAGYPTDMGSLLQTGGFTALAAVLLVFARTAYKRETDRSDRLDEELRKTNELIRDRVMPTLEKSGAALEQATLVLIQIQERMRDGDDIYPLESSGRRHRRNSEDDRNEDSG